MVLSMLTVAPLRISEAQITVHLMNLSPFASMPPKIDGVVSTGEWENAVMFQLTNGWLLAQNDASALYLLIDLTKDTFDDPPQEAQYADNFWLSFDTDLDGEISSVDVNYAPYPSTHTLGMQYYFGPDERTELESTHSQLGAGFGASINARESHRIWELAISLPEIKVGQAALEDSVRLGLRTISSNPRFTDDQPEDFFLDFSNLWEIGLTMPQVDLLILADEEFCETLKPLKAHKEYTGISTYIQSWQSLNQYYGGEGRDAQERVKKGIFAYEQSCGTKYVMLVGDSDRFPVRYCKIYDPIHWGNNFAPSDLYYADLYKSDGSFEDWDGGNPPYGGNGLFGEMNGIPWTPGGKIADINLDNVDLHPDVAVGRVPASTVTEVKTYVEKVITYEFSAYNANWMKNALLIVPGYWETDKNGYYDLSGALNNKEVIASSLLSVGVTSTKLYDPRIANIPGGIYYSDPTPGAINAALNQGVGFVNFAGHGNVGTWAGAYDTPNLELSFGSKIKWKGYFGGSDEILRTGDFNGDGRADLIEFDNTTGEVWVAISTSSGAGPTTKWHEGFCFGNEILSVGDFDGDKKSDIIKFVRSSKTDPDKGDVLVALSTGSSFSKITKWHDYFCLGQEIPEVGDFNGDGKDDIVTFKRSTMSKPFNGDVVVAISNGSGFNLNGTKWHDYFCLGQEIPEVGDFNGDGKADIATFTRSTKTGYQNGDVVVALSNGKAFVSTKIWHDKFCFQQELPRVGDVNGDGKDDIISFSRGSGGNVWVALSKGNGFGPGVRWEGFFCTTGQWPEADDVDGDGFDDIICFTGPTPILGPDFGAVYVTSKLTLENAKKLPVIFSDACYTARFHFDQKYLDITGQEFDPKTGCPSQPICFPVVTVELMELEQIVIVPEEEEQVEFERVEMESLELEPIEMELLELDPTAFKGIDTTNITPTCFLVDLVCDPPVPAAIQRNATKNYDTDAMVEQFLVRRKTGAIAYIGCYTGGQIGGSYLDKYFYEGYKLSTKPAILGNLWNYAMNKYIDNKFHIDFNWKATWYAQAMYHHIQKYMLYGDPSLRIGGVENLMAILATEAPPPIVVQILPELFETPPPETIETTLTPVETTSPLTTFETTFEVVEIISHETDECKIEIVEVIWEGPREDLIERVIVVGIASGCQVIEVTLYCRVELTTVAEVNPDTGEWVAIFEGVQADCGCDHPIEVRTCCLEPPIEGCCTFFELKELPCPPPSEPEGECRIEVMEVFGEGPPEGPINRVIVIGSATGCWVVEVTIFCGGEQSTVVEVNPDTGEWEVIFEDVPADCGCGHPIEVRACCIEPPAEGCCDMRGFEDVCKPPEPPEHLEELRTETSPEPTETSPRPSGIPGFGLIEALITILALLGYKKIRSKR